MRKENITIYSNTLEDNIEREFKIYSRNELIKYIQENNIDLKEYSLEVYAPSCFKCSIEVLESMNVDDEFFILEEDKEIILYLS